MDFFEAHMKEDAKRTAPLADRMRPRTLDEFVGQDHIIGAGRLLRRAIQIDQLSSVIFYGPPGTGKTTLARIIANTTKAQFLSINAVLAGIKEIRDSIEAATRALSLFGRTTILFVDEVHRFNKSQQDALLPHVENGVLILIGATTENPYFEVNKALVSRSRIFQLRTLNENDLHTIAHMALADAERGYGTRKVVLEANALDHLAKTSNGDARGILNALELAVETTAADAEGCITITREIAEESIQQKAVLYDKDGDAHYDTISAFIKSLRGSDPDAALYWMAKMLYAGEDPRFIFRRMIILASEDVGLADPQALSVVVACSQAYDYVGLPEGRFHLSQAALYLSTAKKSNSTLAFFDAIARVGTDVENEVPDPLKDASRDKEGFGHGKGYMYPHAFRDHWVAQQYLPDSLKGRVFYQPSDQGFELQIGQDVARKREALVEAMIDSDTNNNAASSISDTATWMTRTTSDNELAHIRDRIFELAHINSESLFLDLHGRSGLLTLEAMRHITTGGVWSLCHDETSERTLNHLTAAAPALDKPTVLRTSFDTWEEDVRARGGHMPVFSCIAGRDCLVTIPDAGFFLTGILSHLCSGGTLVLAETIRLESQRIADLIPSTASTQEACGILKRAEDEAYATPTLGQHTSDSLVKTLSEIHSAKATASTEVHVPMRHISRSTIDTWFRSNPQGTAPSLGDRIRAISSQEKAESVRLLLQLHLGNADIPWKTTVVYFSLTKKESPNTKPKVVVKKRPPKKVV